MLKKVNFYEARRRYGTAVPKRQSRTSAERPCSKIDTTYFTLVDRINSAPDYRRIIRSGQVYVITTGAGVLLNRSSTEIRDTTISVGNNSIGAPQRYQLFRVIKRCPGSIIRPKRTYRRHASYWFLTVTERLFRGC